ncbi:unnamed protein product [Eruca vesicaria subsp. sativa]|uniref:NAC domain-containing protein n=1 Tax=Eruca vesicaria subsp. sativa TaxID=29727 RepID=A0ABC8KZX6_ERUVS|nr:unnamed protein product [Eruca vesicaria subsp. sativa]
MEDHSIISQEDMEDHFALLSQDYMEEDHVVTSEEEDQMDPEDEVIISYYLNMMINNRKSWPKHFLQDEKANVYNTNPSSSFFYTPSSDYYFIFVKNRRNSCGGSESGCWRTMARDKLIKNEETGRILGFKKILMYCEKGEETIRGRDHVGHGGVQARR